MENQESLESLESTKTLQELESFEKLFRTNLAITIIIVLYRGITSYSQMRATLRVKPSELTHSLSILVRKGVILRDYYGEYKLHFDMMEPARAFSRMFKSIQLMDMRNSDRARCKEGNIYPIDKTPKA